MSTNTKKLKKLLHESIENIDDEEFLHTIKEILEHRYEPKEIEISSYQEKRINKAKNSIKQGDALTNEQADQLVDKWLKE